jgi:anti-sigma factor RsiW
MTNVHFNDERLAAYLEDELDASDELEIEGHLRQCDLCVSGVIRMQPHLRAAGSIAMHIPEALRTGPARQSPSVPPARSHGAFVLRWPVLIPTSLAAGFLLGISVAALRQVAAPPLMTRAVESFADRSAVVGVESPLRRAPSADAEVVASLQTGEDVAVLERQAEWTRIETSGGRQGWIRSEHLR